MCRNLRCRNDGNKDDPSPRYPAWICGDKVQSFDVRHSHGLYAAWDVLRSSKPACLLHAPLIANLLPKWSAEYLVSAIHLHHSIVQHFCNASKIPRSAYIRVRSDQQTCCTGHEFACLLAGITWFLGMALYCIRLFMSLTINGVVMMT